MTGNPESRRRGSVRISNGSTFRGEQLSYQVDRFLGLFAELEREVALIAGQAVRDQSFAEKLRVAQTRDRRVRARYELFDTCRQLRNLLVHQRVDSRPVAEPSPALVDELEKALRLMQHPPQVIQHFRRDLREFSEDSLISEVLAYTSTHNFSQVVVRVEGQLALLSSNTIHRWLAAQASVGLVDLGVPVREVLSHREVESNEVRFAPRKTTVSDALSQFQEGQSRKIVALIITETGRPEEKPLAFLTVWDLGEAIALLNGSVDTPAATPRGRPSATRTRARSTIAGRL